MNENEMERLVEALDEAVRRHQRRLDDEDELADATNECRPGQGD